jgi:hypothetical protein
MYGSQIIDELMNGISHTAKAPKKRSAESHGQQLYYNMIHSPYFSYLWRDHLLVPSDKNMGVALVHNSWMEHHTKKLLDKDTDYESYPDDPDTYQRECWNRRQDFLTKEFSRNPPLYRYLQVDKDQCTMAKFYPIPKVHKTPIAARPICGAPDTYTTKASKLLNDVLLKLEDMLIRHLRATNHGHLYKVVKHTIQALQLADTRTKENAENGYNTFWQVYDFESMYPNMNPVFVENMIESITCRDTQGSSPLVLQCQCDSKR